MLQDSCTTCSDCLSITSKPPDFDTADSGFNMNAEDAAAFAAAQQIADQNDGREHID